MHLIMINVWFYKTYFNFFSLIYFFIHLYLLTRKIYS
jgi:hypothetical protein